MNAKAQELKNSGGFGKDFVSFDKESKEQVCKKVSGEVIAQGPGR